MSRRFIIIALIVATILGSLFTVQASNMFFSDIINIAATGNLFATFAAMSVAICCVLVIFYLLRNYKNPGCKKRITRLYSIIAIVVCLIGTVSTIVSATTVYHTFVGNHPFAGFHIFHLILNLLLIGAGVYGLIKSFKMEQDENRVKVGPRYVFKTIGWFLFTCLLLNRLGTFLGMPTYVYLRNLGQTFPFYLNLLVPTFLGVLEALYILGLLKGKRLFVLTMVALGVNVVFFAYIAIMGMNDSAFVSSLSQAMPLERAASKPVELPIHFLAACGVVAGLLVQYKKQKGAE